MKKLIVTWSLALCLTAYAFAQQAAPRQYFSHENVIKPSMTADYIESIKKLKDLCSKHKINVNWSTFRFDDNTYAHVFPLTSLGTLDKNLFSDLAEKVDKEAYAGIWKEMGKSVESQNQIVFTSIPELTYLAPAEGDIFRALLYLIPIPGQSGESEKVFAEWKKAYQAKKAPSGFEIYRVMFGNDAGYAVVAFAKNMSDFSDKQNKSLDALKDDFQRLWTKQMSSTKKYYWRYGYFIPELGYTNTAAAN